MTKKSAVSFVLSLIVFSVAVFAWLLSEIPQRAARYIQESPQTVNLLEVLNFIQIRDMPGYAGALGRHDAKDAAIEANNIEEDAWAKMNLVGYRFSKNTLISDCVNDVHDKKVNFFRRVAHYSTQSLVETTAVEKLFSDNKEIFMRSKECLQMALTAQEWPTRTWGRIKNSYNDAIAVFKRESTKDTSATETPSPSPSPSPSLDRPVQANQATEAAPTVIAPDLPTEKLKLYRFDQLEQIDFAKLTDAQKKFLEGESAPTQESDVFEGASNAVYKPAIIRLGKHRNSVIVTSMMNFGGGNTTTDFTLYNLDELTSIKTPNFAEWNGRGGATHIRFGIIDGSLVTILEIEAETMGNAEKGNLKCFNKGVKIHFDEEKKTFVASEKVDLGTECPTYKKSSDYVEEISEFNKRQEELFLDNLSKKLLSSNNNEDLNTCKNGLKEHIIAQFQTYTKENEEAVNRNCKELPQEWLCFIDKAKNQRKKQGNSHLSRADEGNFQSTCGII